jgi:hypothetical protein
MIRWGLETFGAMKNLMQGALYPLPMIHFTREMAGFCINEFFLSRQEAGLLTLGGFGNFWFCFVGRQVPPCGIMCVDMF